MNGVQLLNLSACQSRKMGVKMNNEYTDVIDFLRYKPAQEQEHLLNDILKPPVCTDYQVDMPASEFQEEYHVSQLCWDDVLRTTIPPLPPEGDLNILFLRSARQELPEHTHSYFEMIYVLSGTCTHCINGNMEILQTGDLCFLPPAARHIQFPNPSSITAKLVVRPDYFTHTCPGLLQDADYLGTFLVNSIYIRDNEQYLLFHTGHDSDIRADILEIGRESRFTNDKYSSLIISGLLMSLLSRLTRKYPSNLSQAPDMNIHHEILSLLREEYDTITLESLAKRLHYSVPYCSKYIKKMFGMSFSSLLRQFRFQAAEQYLRCSDLTIIQISKRLGYENPENFIRAFKNHFHLTPAQYRKTYSPLS